MLFFVPIPVADLDGGRASIRPLDLCRTMPRVLSGDGDFPVRMHQEPFVSRAPAPDLLGSSQCSPMPLAEWEGPREAYRRTENKKGTEAEKRGYMGKKGRDR